MTNDCYFGVEANAGRLREQRQRRDVTRAQHAEVPSVEGGKLRFTEAFENGEDGCVHEANVSVGVCFTKLLNAIVVLLLKVLHSKSACPDVLQERYSD